ncbi:restriction endonuclease [Devosia sp.]|uniref:restriction endonuclease n=1 Tax=Devosia sp. TaxID=1871048 RepID=UPI001AD472D5|nr:restriction endonuclease [Devosia sp.]MBN9336083.1 restriction endonuclease [Devosia sp.]
MLQNLFSALLDGASIVELLGSFGTGKTTLLQSLKFDRPAVFDGVVEYFIGSSSFPLSQAVDVIADAFRRSKGRNLLVIDEAERLDRGHLLESVSRLSTGPWRFSTIVASTEPLKIGPVIQILPLSYTDMGRLLEAQMGETLPREVLARLWAASQGIPRLGQILATRWRAGDVSTLSDLAEIFGPLAIPGLVDQNGRPLARGGQTEKAIISDVRFVSDQLFKMVSGDPNLVYALTPREFEEFSAELFQRQGYSVTMTPQTRDGGKDLYLARSDGLGSFLYIVECKRYAPDRAVGVGVVRELFGVAQHERLTAAMTLTTSHFSEEAREFAAEVQYQLNLKDFVDLKLLLAPYRDD